MLEDSLQSGDFGESRSGSSEHTRKQRGQTLGKLYKPFS